MTFLESLVKPAVLEQPVYIPGRPIEIVAREIGLPPEAVAKLASNENPLGPSPLAREAARRALDTIHLYPENDCFFLKQRLAQQHGLEPGQFTIGAGSVQIIELLGHLFIQPGVEVVMGMRSFIAYKLVTLLFGGTPIEVPMPNYRHDLDAMRGAVTGRTRLVFLPSPNNPTGTENTEEEILAFARSLPPQVLFVFDEAYAEFLGDAPDLRPLITEGLPVLCTRTFSKIYGLAGLRIGYGYGSAELAGLLDRVRQPFNVNAAAQAAALAALDDTAFVRESREANIRSLAQLAEGFEALGIPFVPSRANFLMAQFDDAAAVASGLQKRGIIARPLAPYGLPGSLRISAGTEAQNRKLLATLPEVLYPSAASK